MITEAQFYDSFPVAEFLMQGFCTPFRLDRSKNCRVILLYIRSHVTSTQLNKYIIKNPLAPL